MIKIEDGIPVPPPNNKKRGQDAIYPWVQIQPGQSILVEKKHVSLDPAKKLVPDSKWTTRTVVKNGKPCVRVWRVE